MSGRAKESKLTTVTLQNKVRPKPDTSSVVDGFNWSKRSMPDGHSDWVSRSIRLAIGISQCHFGDKFQIINPHKDLFMFREWSRNKYASREYHFTREDED